MPQENSSRSLALPCTEKGDRAEEIRGYGTLALLTVKAEISVKPFSSMSGSLTLRKNLDWRQG